MSESCSFYPELQESIYQFRQIIGWGWGKGYSAPATKLFGGLPPPPLPCSYAYVTESFYGCDGIQETLETLSANGFEKRKKVSRIICFYTIWTISMSDLSFFMLQFSQNFRFFWSNLLKGIEVKVHKQLHIFINSNTCGHIYTIRMTTMNISIQK